MNTDGSALTDATSYVVHYGLSPTSLTLSVAVPGGTSTNVTINGLAAGTYYFTVVAVNSTGVTSDPTNTVSTTVP